MRTSPTTAAALLAGCSIVPTIHAAPAGLVLANGKTHTVSGGRAWAEAAFITGKSLFFVGSNKDAKAYTGVSAKRPNRSLNRQG